jgi:hypothetical protein
MQGSLIHQDVSFKVQTDSFSEVEFSVATNNNEVIFEVITWGTVKESAASTALVNSLLYHPGIQHLVDLN